MITPPCVSPQPRLKDKSSGPLTPADIRAIGLSRYGTNRFLAAMSRDTGIPYRTLHRYAREGTERRLAVEAIRGLVAESPSVCG